MYEEIVLKYVQHLHCIIVQSGQFARKKVFAEAARISPMFYLKYHPACNLVVVVSRLTIPTNAKTDRLAVIASHFLTCSLNVPIIPKPESVISSLVLFQHTCSDVAVGAQSSPVLTPGFCRAPFFTLAERRVRTVSTATLIPVGHSITCRRSARSFCAHTVSPLHNGCNWCVSSEHEKCLTAVMFHVP